MSLELLGGSVEVMVWSNAYDRTQHLWYEGSIVQIAGRARLRGEEISLSCDEASPYAPDAESETALSQETRDSDTNGRVSPAPVPSAATNGHGAPSMPVTASNGNGSVSLPGSPVEGVANVPSSPKADANGSNSAAPRSAKLWIRLEESSDPVRDEYLLRGVVKLLMNYPGKGAVGLRIITEGRTVIGELPELPIDYCPELHEELEIMVGAGSVEVEGGDGVAS